MFICLIKTVKKLNVGTYFNGTINKVALIRKQGSLFIGIYYMNIAMNKNKIFMKILPLLKIHLTGKNSCKESRVDFI